MDEFGLVWFIFESPRCDSFLWFFGSQLDLSGDGVVAGGSLKDGVVVYIC